MMMTQSCTGLSPSSMELLWRLQHSKSQLPVEDNRGYVKHGTTTEDCGDLDVTGRNPHER